MKTAPKRKASSVSSDKAVGARIKERRTAMDIGQADLGVLIGKSVAMMSRYESGEYSLNTGQLVKVAERLGCTVDDLVYGKKK